MWKVGDIVEIIGTSWAGKQGTIELVEELPSKPPPRVDRLRRKPVPVPEKEYVLLVKLHLTGMNRTLRFSHRSIRALPAAQVTSGASQ